MTVLKNVPRVVCLIVDRGEESYFQPTLQSVCANTQTTTDIVLIAVNADLRLLKEFWIQESHAGKYQNIIEATGTDLLSATLTHLPDRFQSYDLAYVRPGVELPYGWDGRLALAATQVANIAAVSPLCNIAPLFSLGVAHHEPKPAVATIDQLVYELGKQCNFEVPSLLSSCGYLRREALARVQTVVTAEPHEQDAEAFWWHFAQRFRHAGLPVVACDHVYIEDSNPRHQREMAMIEQREEIELFGKAAHPLTSLKYAVDNALAQKSMPVGLPEPLAPVQLHVAHSLGGGLDRWVKNYCEHDQIRTNLVLRSIGSHHIFGKRIALYRSADMDKKPLQYWDLIAPIYSTAITHLQYKAILDEIISAFQIEVILVSSLIGHSLDVLTTDRQTIVITHDYYPFCPAIYIYFDGVCQDCSTHRLQSCFEHNEQNQYVKNRCTEEWLGIRKRYIELMSAEHITVVSPSASVPQHFRQLMPTLKHLGFNLVPHGATFPSTRAKTNIVPSNAGKLRLVVLGILSLPKGQKLWSELYPQLHDIADCHLVGAGDEAKIYADQPHVHLIPHYQNEDLPEILNTIKPDLGILLSIWPETFSYTLSELWLLGIPPLTTDLGSFADRIEDGVNGFLVPPDSTAVVEKLRLISNNRALLDPIKTWLTDFQHRSITDMIAEYHRLTPLPEFSAQRYFSERQHIPVIAPEPDPPPPVLSISPEARFSAVLQAFGGYITEKINITPRLTAWQRKLLLKFVKTSFICATRLMRVADRRR